MEPSIEGLRKNYKKFSDEKLIRLATTDASGMRPEAIQVMHEEIESRGLSDSLIKGIEVQRRELNGDELSDYCEIIRTLPCPICSSKQARLNATITSTVVSFLVFTSSEDKLVIACPKCLNKANTDAMVKSGLLGWWAPLGIIRTINALISNKKMASHTQLAEPNIYLIDFVLKRAGAIETNKRDYIQLLSLIKT